jgi:hypothetical protein
MLSALPPSPKFLPIVDLACLVPVDRAPPGERRRGSSSPDSTSCSPPHGLLPISALASPDDGAERMVGDSDGGQADQASAVGALRGEQQDFPPRKAHYRSRFAPKLSRPAIPGDIDYIPPPHLRKKLPPPDPPLHRRRKSFARTTNL